METDQTPLGRRSLLRIALCTGAAAAVAPLFSTGGSGTPGRPAAPAPAAGPQAFRAGVHKASAYRLRPMTASAPYQLTRGATPVREEPFLRMPSLGRSMVLTFDDGPDPLYTPDILRILRGHDVRAMFFVCGQRVADNGDLLRRIADDGHVVGNHSWSHPLLPDLTPSRIRAELERTSELIEKTIGTPPLWHRAPYGAWNRRTFEIGAELGMEPLAWTIDTLDWREPGTSAIVGRVVDEAEPGAVVLSHDAGGDRSQSVAALRRYLPKLRRSGYRLTVPMR
ncbi:polysaccharide deacetylase family protein [Streptomyces sp. FIT100]|nr:polysaccharide deacetylase family protein [Streptomyces sp. FIT100]